jgi:hypothetical protein
MDVGYNGLNPPDVSVTNNDNDSAGIVVTTATNLRTTEAGGNVTFRVNLQSQPGMNVIVPIVSSDTTEGTVSPGSLTFTPTNWAAPQTVTVTGVDDAVQDGNQPYTVRIGPATSTDANYSGRSGDSVAVSNLDNDIASIIVSPAAGHTKEPSVSTTFTIVLNAQPTAPVTIPLSSSDTTEGTLAVSQVVFTTTNWNAPQTITVTGVDDSVQDGNQPYNIITGSALSTDLNYNGVNGDDVALVNDDNDIARINVNAAAGLTTTEGGGTATFTVVLNTQPTANVTIPIASSKATEGVASPASLVFTTTTGGVGGWNVAQTVTVTGHDDAVTDGNQPYVVRVGPATSTDPLYNTLSGTDVSLTNRDNDVAGIIVSATNLITSEDGATATFTIALASPPAGLVIIPIASTNQNEGTVTPTVVQFDSNTYATLQTITVTGVDDARMPVQDGDQVYSIVSDPLNPQLGFQAQSNVMTDGYSGLSVPGVAVTNVDNETPAGLTFAPILNCSGPSTAVSCDTSLGGTGTFSVRLSRQPLSNVVLSIPSVAGQATVSPTSITFNTMLAPAAGSWQTPVTISVTGTDPTNPTIRSYNVQATAMSTDVAYNNLIATIAGVNNPSAAAAALVITAGANCTGTPVTCDTTNGRSATFTVQLATQPANDVGVTITSNMATTEGAPDTTTLTFTGGSWNTPVPINVLGLDTMNVAPVNYQVTVATTVATAAPYNGKSVNVAFTNGAIAVPPMDDGGVDDSPTE